MKLKKNDIFRLTILTLLIGTIVLSMYAVTSGVPAVDDNNTTETGYIDTKTLRVSQSFELIQDFEASSSHISPESSPGFNDEVFFSFMANKEGNFTLEVNNFPSLLTKTIEMEDIVAFDNPSGTDLWYIAYLEVDIELDGVNLKRFGDYEIKFMKSEDKGETWNSTTVATLSPSGNNIIELLSDLEECAIAAYPEKGIVGIVTWYNASDLLLFSSYDNGTTWNSPEIVATVADIGYAVNPIYPFHPWRGGPALEIGILKNTSIYVITEAPDSRYTPSIYFESHNNGTDWSGAKNITVMQGINFAEPVKMQVDHQSGDYWLMWEYQDSGTNYISWAEYQETSDETLNSMVPTQIIYNGPDCNFDFLYDKGNNLFRLIQITKTFTPEGPKFEVINRTTSTFGPFGPGTSLGFHRAFFQKYQSYTTFNFAYDGKYFQFFFAETYTAISEVYQYILYEDPVFWEEKGNFEPFELRQVFWNGRTTNNSPINISTVRVILFVQNGTDVLNRTIFITIDNEYPEFDVFNQKNHYFNPLSGNITLSQIPWDLLGSEECDAILEIFKQGSSLSDWQRITDNNLHETNPKIFRSDTGELYILYVTMEVGTSTVNLIKSFDNGITWSKPVEIATFAGLGTPRYWGAASGQIVIVYLFDPSNFDHIIYRSFDAGETFEPPFIPSDLNMIMSDSVSNIILTRNKTLFLTYLIYQNPNIYRVLRSDTLGFDWTISGDWTNNSANFSNLLSNRLPDLAYDQENDLVHIVMPIINNSAFEQFHVANFTFATLNLTTNVWGDTKGVSTGPFPIGYFISDPKFLVLFNDNPINPIKIVVRYIHEQQITGGLTNYTFKEIASTDLGETWSGPKFIQTNNATIFTSSLFDIFYASTKSDGHDYEVYFSREGSLVRAKRESLSPTIVTEITFDGKNDFGEYITEGNYSYNIILRDDAGNQVWRNGWFYADYNAPIITDHAINWTITPIPRFDVNVTVNVTHNILGFTTYLYYKTDLGSWQRITMNNIGSDQFSAVIPGDTTTNLIQYYMKAVDLAGNEFYLDRESLYYTYDMPRFEYDSEGLFEESESYSSSQDYDVEVEITHDLQYVDEVNFRYSYDGGDEWDDLELEQGSPVFSGTLDDIPGDLRELQYKIILIDIFGNEISLTSTREIEFYPDTPNIEFAGSDIFIIVAVSAAVGVLVAVGYIKLKTTSHETIYKQLFLKKYAQKMEKPKKSIGKKLVDKIGIGTGDGESRLESLEQAKIATSFTMVYVAVLCGTILIFSIALMTAIILPEVGMLLLAGSLLLAVFGYMILMSRDITINIYLEKIYLKNVALEIFQIFFMFVNILMILFVGFTIDWFRYYLIESTFNVGAAAIPRLYVSIFAVFFTSLVLVGITTYIQLRKTVKNLQEQRSQGASANLLLYLKDQDSSRLITRLGYKTIVFLVTVLLGIVTTTNLLTEETGNALMIVIIPFAIASFVVLIGHRYFEMKSKKEKKEEIELPFSDSKKYCGKCGKEMYLSDKFCGSCSAQQIFEEKYGTYISRCTECGSYINDKAEYCTECGVKIQSNPKK